MKPSLLLQFCFNSCRKRNRKSDNMPRDLPRFELSIINEVPSFMETYTRRHSTNHSQHHLSSTAHNNNSLHTMTQSNSIGSGDIGSLARLSHSGSTSLTVGPTLNHPTADRSNEFNGKSRHLDIAADS